MRSVHLYLACLDLGTYVPQRISLLWTEAASLNVAWTRRLYNIALLTLFEANDPRVIYPCSRA